MLSKIWGFLSDPTLHLMVTALVLIYLMLAGFEATEPATSPLVMHCQNCQGRHFPETPCLDSVHRRFAQVHP